LTGLKVAELKNNQKWLKLTDLEVLEQL